MRRRTVLPFLLIIILVSGCGGGGGTVSSTSTGENLRVIQTDSPGDVNNLFPLTVGSTWGYHVTSYETGQQPTDNTEEVKVSGTKQVDGNTAFVLSSFNVDNPTVIDEEYFLKNNAAAYYLGDNSLTISLFTPPTRLSSFPYCRMAHFCSSISPGLTMARI